MTSMVLPELEALTEWAWVQQQSVEKRSHQSFSVDTHVNLLTKVATTTVRNQQNTVMGEVVRTYPEKP